MYITSSIEERATELSAGFFVILDFSNRGIHWDCYPLVFTADIKCQKYNFKSPKLAKLGGIACHLKIGNACQSIGDALVPSYSPCRNFSNFFLKTTRSVIFVHILVLVSMKKYILNHKKIANTIGSKIILHNYILY